MSILEKEIKEKYEISYIKRILYHNIIKYNNIGKNNGRFISNSCLKCIIDIKTTKDIDKYRIKNLRNKLKKNKYNSHDLELLKKYILRYLKYHYNNVKKDLTRFLLYTLKYIIFKEEQEEILISKIRNNYSFLRASIFNDTTWKIDKDLYFIIEKIKNNYDYIYKIALRKIGIKNYDMIITFDDILKYKANYFIYKYLYSKEAKEFTKKYPNG